MRVAVIGQGSMGAAATWGFAEIGHTVTGVECDPGRLEKLRRGGLPVYEPGLAERMVRLVRENRLSFTRTVHEIGVPLDAVVVAVATPTLSTGITDLGQVRSVLDDVLALRPVPRLVVVKSTIPPGTSRELAREYRSREFASRYVHSPEFFSQGRAVADWHRPARTVVGFWNAALLQEVEALFDGVDGPWVRTTPTNAELIKYASNAFVAMKLSFANELADLCEGVGADVYHVLAGAAHDPRIGADGFRVGPGYGDTCLTKDIQAMVGRARVHGCALPLLGALEPSNELHRMRPVRMVREYVADGDGSTPIAVLGLTFEPGCNDMRHAQSQAIVPELRRLTDDVRVWEPLLTDDEVARTFPGVTVARTPKEAVSGAGAVLVLTEHEEILRADFGRLAPTLTEPRVVVDPKNCLDGSAVVAAGLVYRGMGRGVDRVPDVSSEARSAWAKPSRARGRAAVGGARLRAAEASARGRRTA